MKMNAVLAYCTLSYFQYSLQLALVFILFTINTWNRNKENVSKYDYVYQAANYLI